MNAKKTLTSTIFSLVLMLVGTAAADPAVVYFTHDISPEGLVKAYKALGRPLEGKRVAVKISTGEAGNNHYLKP